MSRVQQLYRNIYLLISLFTVFSGIVSFSLRCFDVEFFIVFINIILYFYSIVFFFYKKNIVITRESLFVLAIMSITFVGYFTSVLYTISDRYEIKLLYLTYSLSFIVIAYIVSNYCSLDSLFKLWFNIIFVYNIVVFFLLLSMNFDEYAFGQKFYYHYLPDYLLSAIFSYSACFFALLQKRASLKIMALFIVAVQIYLGARAPLVFFIIICVLLYYKQYGYRVTFRIYHVIFILSVIFVLLVSNVTRTIVNRFSVVFSDSSMYERVRQYEIALKTISENVILGQGVNSSGLILTGKDTVFDYPHNIFLELWMEVGILPFLLFLFLFVYFLLKLVIGKGPLLQMITLCFIVFFFLNGLKSQSVVEIRYLYFFIGLYIFYNNKHENSFS